MKMKEEELNKMTNKELNECLAARGLNPAIESDEDRKGTYPPMTSKRKIGRIERMKTYLRRWWLINRLYHACRTWDGIKWIEESSLIAWMSGLDVKNDRAFDDNGEWSKKQAPWIYRKVLFWLYNCKDWNSFYTEVRNVVIECEEKEWIKKHKDGAIPHINLATVGMEKYAFSSLIFGTDYGKKIWTGIIVGLVVWYATDRIHKTIPQTIQIQYAPQEIPRTSP